MEDLVAYCGVDCSACQDYESGACPSCRVSEWSEDDICLPVRCCRDKGLWSCASCDGFPCEDMAAFYGESESHGQAYQRMLGVRATQS